jgi:four helix bundle protein
MQPKPNPPTFLALELSIEAVRLLAPVVKRVRQYDRDLGEQLRRSLSSVALNLAEGRGCRGGTRLARYATAAGSLCESRAALRVAEAWGYLSREEYEVGEAKLDRIAAMLYGLGVR